MAPPTTTDLGWLATHHDPKWAFPQLDLGISPPSVEEDKDKDKDDAAADGCTLPKPTNDPKDFWGSNDKDPPSVGTTFAA